MDRAYIERAVYEPPDRVQVSATARLFTGATRRGIQLRDRECTHPYCDRPAVDCQVDHIQPFGQHGPTIQENGRLLCGYHNRLRTQPGTTQGIGRPGRPKRQDVGKAVVPISIFPFYRG